MSVHSNSPRDVRNSARQQLDGMDEEMKMLKWYKLANEAALKAAIVKNKKFKSGSRYNPAAERVRERSYLLRRVIAEEQNKPLELPKHEYTRLVQQEEDEQERRRGLAMKRYQRINSLQAGAEDKEQRRQRYALFLERQKKEKSCARLRSRILDAKRTGLPADELQHELAIQEAELRNGALEEEGESLGRKVFEQSMVLLSECEEKLWDLAPTVESQPNTMTINTSSEWGTGVVDPQRNAQVTFLKKKTETKLSAPSKTLYAVRLLPGQYDALQPPRNPLEISMEQHGSLPSTARSMPEQRRGKSSSKGRGGKKVRGSTADSSASLGRALDRAKAKTGKDGAAARDIAASERSNDVIKAWMRDRLHRQLEREKRMRDRIKADRAYLRSLQRSKALNEEKQAAGGQLPATTVNKNNIGGHDVAQEVSEGALDAEQKAAKARRAAQDEELRSLDARLALMEGQQKKMESWRLPAGRPGSAERPRSKSPAV